MADWLPVAVPAMLMIDSALLVYLVRVEHRLTRIETILETQQ